jgi:multiple sugar transport system substrate-binding protein
VTLAAVVGCGADDATDAVSADFGARPSGAMTAWAFDNADDVGKARMAQVASALADVKVTYDQTGFNAQKFTTRLAGGDVPDVVQMDRQFVATYAAQGLILPLDECFAAQDVRPREPFYGAVVDDVTYRGQIWGVPQFFQPAAIMVDTSVLSAAGVSAADIDTSRPDVLLAAITKMYQESGGVPSRLGFDSQPTGQANLWFAGLGGRLVDQDGKPTLDDPANLHPLQLLKQIADAQGGYAKVKSFVDAFDFFGANNQYVRHQVGAELNAQWYPNVLSAYKGSVTLAAVPFKDRSGKPVGVTTGGQAFVVPAKAANPAAACAWAVKLTAKDNWMAAAQARATTLTAKNGINTGLFTGSPEPDKAIREAFVKPSGDQGFDQTIATYYDVVEAGVSAGSSPAGQNLKNDLNNAITAVLLGEKNPEQALADAQQSALRAYETVTR